MSNPADHSTTRSTGRTPIIGFALLIVVAVLSVWAYIEWRTPAPPSDVTAEGVSREPAPQIQSPSLLERIRSRPHVYYTSTRSSEFGKVVVSTLEAPNVDRFVTDLECARIDFGRTRGICLVDNRVRVVPPGLARIVDRNLHTIHTLDLPGVPSRTRLSPDERYAATTVFVLGEHYTGIFATRTYIIDMESGALVGDLERFTTWRDNTRFSRVDFNFWGVTFLHDSNRFYATLATGGVTYLVSGDIAQRRIDVLRTNVECPSLSPDEMHLAFKSRAAGSSEWRLHVLDLTSMNERPIAAETRRIDDQVEWLDDGHVLYQFIEERGLPEVAANVWVSPLDAGAGEERRVLIQGGLSPAIVR